MCQNNNQQFHQRNRFFGCRCFSVALERCIGHRSSWWLFFHRLCVYVFFHLCFVWQTTSFHAYCFYAFVLLNAILLIREFLVYIIIGEEYKTLLFDLFRLLLLLLRRRRHRLRRFLHVYFIIRFFSSKVANNKGKCHFAMLSRMTVIYGQVMRNQSGSLNFANGQIQKQTAYEKKQWP